MDLQIEAVKVQDPVSYLHALSKEPREWRELPALRRRIGYDPAPAQQQAAEPQARALAQRPSILSALFSLCAHEKRAEQTEVQYTSIITVDAGDTAASEALQALFQKVVFAEAIYVGRSEWVARCSNPTQLSTDIVQSAAEDGGLGSLLAELHFCERAPAEAEHGLYELHAPANFPQDARMFPLVADARANCLDLSALSLQECLQSPAVGAVCAAKERVCLLIDRTDPSQKTLYWK